ncbi:yeats family-domain-containing protein [Radiomyces spectabilis]|uniref:yeats family-domain-containing protein n=1 Tax=Radiomyces spectabilis TaxID=64574 RepID=UPI002220DABE|nr:yeats family-domain-containing protein [Radiomyces spectabilis]KAI8368222.1 yeats family-domain-containing protein [Radiomyces spectabilis]
MTELHQDIKVTNQSHLSKDKSLKPVDGVPWREWKVTIVAVDKGKEQKGKLSKIVDHVEYILHPTFATPRKVVKKEPYTIQEKGWGEFDLRIVLYFKHHWADPEAISFDINFQKPHYSSIHTLVFRDPAPELTQLLSNGEYTGQVKDDATDLSPTVSNTIVKDEDASPERLSPTPSLDSPGQQPSSPLSDFRPVSPMASPTLPEMHHTNNTLTDLSISTEMENTEHDEMMQNSQDENIIGETAGNEKAQISDDEHSVAEKLKNLVPEKHEIHVQDEVYSDMDLQHLNPVHSMDIDDTTRRAWGIPKNVDMLELARRLSNMTQDQAEAFHDIIQENSTDDMSIEETEGEIVLDLYSLGPNLLELLWKFSESVISRSSSPSTSSDSVTSVDESS